MLPTIAPASLSDLITLSRFHYRSGPPATFARILAAHIDGHLAGVLAVSMPTLNGAWRSLAWPGDYDTGPKRRRALRLNRDVRTISRVIVDPRFRARGIARALIRAYLDDPLTRRTEAIASMGDLCPVFQRAGMRSWRLPPPLRDQRLIDALHHVRIPPHALALRPRALAASQHPLIAREIRRWANDSRATRAKLDSDLISLAAARLCTHRLVFTSG